MTSSAKSGASTLIATSRLSDSSRARKTIPIPPRPMRLRRWIDGRERLPELGGQLQLVGGEGREPSHGNLDADRRAAGGGRDGRVADGAATRARVQQGTAGATSNGHASLRRW